VTIEIIPPIIGKADADLFVMVVWDRKANGPVITLGGGYTESQRLAAALLLKTATEELEGKR
jgi:hypothetical protein